MVKNTGFKLIHENFIDYLVSKKSIKNKFVFVEKYFIKNNIDKMVENTIQNEKNFWNYSFENAIKELPKETMEIYIIFYRMVDNCYSKYTRCKPQSIMKDIYPIESYIYKGHKSIPENLSGFISGLYRQ